MLRTLSSSEGAVTALGVVRAASMASVMCVIRQTRHARACPGHPRLTAFVRKKPWMAGTPSMTPVKSVLPPKPFGLARQIDGLHFLKLDAAILDEIVQWRIGRTRDLHAIKIDLERATVILFGPGRRIADTLHSGRYPVGFLVEALLDVFTGRAAILGGPFDGFLHVQRGAEARDVVDRPIGRAGRVGHLGNIHDC